MVSLRHLRAFIHSRRAGSEDSSPWVRKPPIKTLLTTCLGLIVSTRILHHTARPETSRPYVLLSLVRIAFKIGRWLK